MADVARRRQADREYYAAHHEARKAAARQYYWNNRGAVIAKRRADPGKAALIYARSRRGVENEALYLATWAGRCVCCATTPAGGVDRIDSSQGYTATNMQPMCSACNYAKRKMPMAEFLWWRAEVALQVAKEAGLYKKHA